MGANIPVGSPLELSPKNKAVVSVNYTLPLPTSIGKISAGVTGSHTDKQLANYVYTGDPTNITALGGNYSYLAARNLLDANASWNSIMGSTIDLSFFGTNLTNLHYYSYIPGLGTPAVGFETAVLGEPRMFGVRARYRFGGGFNSGPVTDHDARAVHVDQAFLPEGRQLPARVLPRQTHIATEIALAES